MTIKRASPSWTASHETATSRLTCPKGLKHQAAFVREVWRPHGKSPGNDMHGRECQYEKPNHENCNCLRKVFDLQYVPVR